MKTSNDQLVTNLVDDPYFHKWIIAPDKACLEFWSNWGDQSVERRECMEQAREILLSFKFKPTSIAPMESSRLWTQITEQIEKPASREEEGRKNNSKNLLYGIAATIALFVTVFLAYNKDLARQSEITTPEISLVEKVAPEGKISKLTFEDGTVVKLFSGSIIRYPSNFGTTSREVYLDGEGFFEVTRDTERPFTVKTNTLKTTALGTSFNVRTYEDNSKCDVSLVTGKVKVELMNNSPGNGNTVFLEPGEEAYMESEGVLKQPFDIEETTAWKDGHIYLENKSFDETITILKRWFQVDFIVKNRNNTKLKEKTGKGTFKNQSLDNILRVVGHSFEFKYEIQHETVILTF